MTIFPLFFGFFVTLLLKQRTRILRSDDKNDNSNAIPFYFISFEIRLEMKIKTETTLIQN